MMQTKMRSNNEYSILGLGCMNLPLDNIRETEQIIHYAYEQGITYFDTADVYQNGQNETIVGSIVRELMQQDSNVIIGTKGGNRFHDVESFQWDPNPEYLRFALEQSLNRLKLDKIPLYLIHGGTIEDDLVATIETVKQFKEDGLIDSYGLSSIRPNVINEYVKHSELSTVMMQYNPIDNRPESIFNLLDKHDIPVLVRGSIMKGLFTKNYEQVLIDKFSDGFESVSSNELREQLRQIELDYNDLTTYAYKYIIDHANVLSIVVGASSLDQLKSNIESYRNLNELKDVHNNKNVFKDINYINHNI